LTLAVNVSGTNHSAQSNVRVSGVWHFCIWWQMVSGVWKQISAALSVSCPDVVKSDSGISSPFTVSASATITPSGSVGPYTCSTAYLSGDVISTSGLTTSTPGFSKSFSVAPGNTVSTSTNYRATVTDGFGNSAHHDFNVFLEYSRS